MVLEGINFLGKPKTVREFCLELNRTPFTGMFCAVKKSVKKFIAAICASIIANGCLAFAGSVTITTDEPNELVADVIWGSVSPGQTTDITPYGVYWNVFFRDWDFVPELAVNGNYNTPNSLEATGYLVLDSSRKFATATFLNTGGPPWSEISAIPGEEYGARFRFTRSPGNSVPDSANTLTLTGISVLALGLMRARAVRQVA